MLLLWPLDHTLLLWPPHTHAIRKQAPLCMGIAHDDGAASITDGVQHNNVYWAYDGGNGNSPSSPSY